jgi:hypothetical protein
MTGIQVSSLGNGTTMKALEKGKIHTVPILLVSQCRSTKERLENIVRKVGFFVSCQWPKEMLGFVQGVRDKVEGMGFEKKDHFTRVRPTLVEGTVYIGADIKKKGGGKFEKIAYWRIPLLDKTQRH